MSGLLAVLVVVCGCSSGASSAGRRSLTPTGPAAPAGPQVQADRARAGAAVLRTSDLPAGWTASPHTGSSIAPGVDERLAGCLGVSVGVLNRNNPTEAYSDDFSDANGDEVTNSVGYETSVGRARQMTTLLQSSRMPACLSSAISSYLAFRLAHPTGPAQTVPSGLSLGRPTTVRLPFPTLGDATVAYRFTVPIEGAGSPLTVFGDFIFVAKGRAGSVLTVESQGTAPDRALEQRLVSAVEDRLIP